MRLIDEILNDINQAKQKITSVELEIGHASGPSNQVDTLIQVENLLTYCHSRLSGIDPESLRPQGHWIGEANGYADGELVYDVWYCSECNHCIDDGTDDPDLLPDFCPGCGAYMKGAGEDADS